MENFISILNAAEYEHYGVRAHRAAAVVGKSLGNSKVWVDGEMTDDEVAGISTIKVRSAADMTRAIATLRDLYCWGDAQIVLVGGDVGEWGEDNGEYVIRDNICLAVL